MLLNNCWKSKDTGFLKASADLTEVKVPVQFTFLGRKRSKGRFFQLLLAQNSIHINMFCPASLRFATEKLGFPRVCLYGQCLQMAFSKDETGYVINAPSLRVPMFCFHIVFSFFLIMFVAQHKPKIFCSSTFTIHFYYMRHVHT